MCILFRSEIKDMEKFLLFYPHLQKYFRFNLFLSF